MATLVAGSSPCRRPSGPTFDHQRKASARHGHGYEGAIIGKRIAGGRSRGRLGPMNFVCRGVARMNRDAWSESYCASGSFHRPSLARLRDFLGTRATHQEWVPERV
jgi:hypothetical protein